MQSKNSSCYFGQDPPTHLKKTAKEKCWIWKKVTYPIPYFVLINANLDFDGYYCDHIQWYTQLKWTMCSGLRLNWDPALLLICGYCFLLPYIGRQIEHPALLLTCISTKVAYMSCFIVRILTTMFNSIMDRLHICTCFMVTILTTIYIA